MTRISRRRFLAGSSLAALGGAALLAGCSSASDGAASKQGASTAIGSGLGKHGNMDIEVSVSDGAINRISVLSSRETPGLGDVAMDRLSGLIVQGQTLNVDAVSGATLSSMAFLGAVSKALDELGEDSAEWKKRDKALYAHEELMPESVDVVVIGAGGAGFAAAITAANEGRSVLMMEKMGVLGGDTALSGGEMAVPGNWIQGHEGIQDGPDALAEDMLAGGDHKGRPELVAVVAQGALESSQWLSFEGGVAWKHDLMQFGGHNAKRSLIPLTHSGSEMTTKLTRRAKEMDSISIMDCTQAVEIIQEGGVITGVRAKDTISGNEMTVSCRAVVLACGGFGSNVEMRVKYNPEMDDKILSTDSVGVTGDGISMGEAVGANLVDMEYIQTYPVCDPGTGALLYVGDVRLESQAIMVNKEGMRFVEELDRRDVISKAITEQTGGQAYLLFNQAGADKTGLLETHSDEYENILERGVLVKGDSVEEACEAMQVDAAGVKATIEAWNAYCADGKDPEFNYRGELNAIEGGPYYLMACKPAVHYTMGGLEINVDAQVLSTEGAPIAGLYAAGEVTGGIMGTNRLGSCSMTDIFTFGRIAGKGAADYSA